MAFAKRRHVAVENFKTSHDALLSFRFLACPLIACPPDSIAGEYSDNRQNI
jgi:hypothetical protein